MGSLWARLEASWHHGRGALAVPVAALALLALFAFFQYQWISGISQAEGERLRSSLTASTNRFTQDLNSEVAFVYLSVVAPRRPTTEDRRDDLKTRYQHWAAAAPNRNLIKRLYITASGDSGSLSPLYSFDPKTQAFKLAEWPTGLAARRDRMSDRLATDPRPGGFVTVSASEDGSPLLAAPQLGGPGPPAPPSIRGWSIAELDASVLASEILPELVHKHYGSDYYVRIVEKRDPAKVLFRSSETPKEETFDKADVKEGVLEIRPGGRTFAQLAAAGGQPFFAQERFRAALPPPPGPPPGAGPQPERGARPPDRDRSQWWLMVRHRKGSLEQAVSETRRRNLAISMAMLFLMGGSIALLVLSARRAQRLARLQMEFVAGISHELRTPLSVICSAADNLADGLVNREQQIRRYGSLIRNEGRRLTDMVEQILGFAGFESGKRKLDLQLLDVTKVINDAVASCEREIRESGCTIETTWSESLPQVLGDPTTLTQCMRNLVSNALKYGRDGGWVGIRAEVPIGAEGKVEIVVEDRGPGVAASDLPYIFDPFYRGGKAVSDQTHGAGIGLSLVKRIVEAHSGLIEVESPEDGRGSRFVMRLPAASAVAQTVPHGGLPGDGATNPAH